MIAPDRSALFDGGLTTWALFIVAHGAAAVISALTIAILFIRLMIIVREWKARK